MPIMDNLKLTKTKNIKLIFERYFCLNIDNGSSIQMFKGATLIKENKSSSLNIDPLKPEAQVSKSLPETWRTALEQINATLKTHGQAVKNLTKQLALKSSKNEVLSLIGSKLSISQLPVLLERYLSSCSANGKFLYQQSQSLDSDLGKFSGKQHINNMEKSQKDYEQIIERAVERKLTVLKGELATIRYDDRLENQEYTNKLLNRVEDLELHKEILERESQEIVMRFEEVTLRKAERSETENLYKLTKMFERQLENLGRGLVELSKASQEDHLQSLQNTLSLLSKRQQESIRTLQNGLRSMHDRMQDLVSLDCFNSFVATFKAQDEKRSKDTSELYSRIQKLQSNIQSLTSNQETYLGLNQSLESRLQMLELRENAINKMRLDINRESLKLCQISNQFEPLTKRMEQVENLLSRLHEECSDNFHKIAQTQHHLGLEMVSKLDAQKFKTQMGFRITKDDYIRGMAEVSERCMVLIRKIDVLKEQFLNFKLNESRLNQSFTLAFQQKPTFADIQKAVENMVTRQQLKAIKNELQKQLESVVKTEKMEQWISDQSVINETLCTQNITARWLWLSGKLSNGNLITWEKQVINTLPDNFTLCQDQESGNSSNSTAIRVSAGGIYKLEMCVYSRKKPTIQVIVNGQAVMSAVNNSSYVIHHSSGKLRDITNKTNVVGLGMQSGNSGLMGGLSVVDYLLLPNRARVAVSYIGDEGEGFLSLKRL